MDDKIYSRNRIRLPKIIIQNNRNPNKNTSKVLKITAILVIAISVAGFSLKGIQPIIEKNCKSMAKSVATKVSNIKATEEKAKKEGLFEYELDYNHIRYVNEITKDEYETATK